MKDYQALVWQARQNPDSTAALAIISMREEDYRRSAKRRAAVRSFFSRVFSLKKND